MLTFRKIANKPLFFSVSIILVLISMIVIFEMLGWPFLKAPLEKLMAQNLERNIKIDRPFKLKLIGGVQIKAAGFWISAPAEFKVPNLANAKGLELQLRYSDLWNIKDGDPYGIKSIKAEQVDANLVRLLNGRSTWQFNKDENDPIRPFPVIQTLVIRKGQAHVNDSLTKANLVVSFDTNEGKSNTASISKVAIKGDFRERKLKSELITHGFLPIASQDKNSPPVSSKGWLEYGNVHMDFDGFVYDLFGEQTLKGKLAVNGSSLGELGDLLSITLPRTTAFEIMSDVERNQEGWLIDIASAHVGQSDLYGKFKYDTRPEKSLLQGELKGKRFVLADLAPAFGSADVEPGKRERIFPDKPLDFATYNRMNADISVDIDHVDLGKAFREPIKPFKASLDLNKNKLSLAKIDARTAQGSISGDIYIDAHEQKNVANPQQEKNLKQIKPDWNINLAVKDINLEKWLQISAARKKNSKEANKSEASQAYVTGFLNGKAKFEGKGNSTAQLLQSLNGDLSLYVRNGKISHLIVEAVGLDIAQAIGVLIEGDKPIVMECAVMDFKAKQGILKSNVALIDTPVTTIVLDGNIDMGEEKFDLRMMAEPKNFSPFTIRSPIHLTGTFLNPNVAPETAPIGARVAGGILLALINPLAAILPFLDPGKISSNTNDVTCNNTLIYMKKNNKQGIEKNKLSSVSR
ncbi:MAG TPA: AsmA family protein [Methylotenera sp.]|nr:AsmA family protein [Methylotenera sp.]